LVLLLGALSAFPAQQRKALRVIPETDIEQIVVGHVPCHRLLVRYLLNSGRARGLPRSRK
jgi:hypothetical protein